MLQWSCLAQGFYLSRGFDYWFHLQLVIGLIRFFIFFLIPFWYMCVSENISNSSRLSKFVGLWFFMVFFNNSFYFCKISSNIPTFSFDFYNWGSIFFFFLISLVKILSILLIFSNSQTLILQVFSIVFLICLFYLPLT